MDLLGPTYPFEPLPPPEHPSARRSHTMVENVVKNKYMQSEDIQGVQTAKDFSTILENKTAEKVLETAQNLDELNQLRKAAEDLEAFFLYSILKGFNSANMESELFPKSAGHNLYMDMFFEGIANQIAHSRGGLGLSDMIVKQLEVHQKPNEIT